jgi:hypothetical protein
MFRPTSSKEYYRKIRVNLNDLSKMYTAQRAAYWEGLSKNDMAALVSALNGVSTILSFLFLLPTGYAVAGAISGLIANLGSGLSELKYLVDKGSLAIADAENWLFANPQYDMIEINYPFLEYIDATANESIRFVQAVERNSWDITAIHIKGGSGWQLL